MKTPKGFLATMVVLTFLVGCTANPDTKPCQTPNRKPSSPLYQSSSLHGANLGPRGGQRVGPRFAKRFDGPVLMLWVAAGCSGCHDWTAMLKEELENGNISNTTNIVSVHRYPSFESSQAVAERY